MSLKQNKGQASRFPSHAKRLHIVEAFSINADGSISISQWLSTQVITFDKSSRGLDGESFRARCVEWFKNNVAFVAARKGMQRIKGRNRTVIDDVNRHGLPCKRVQQHRNGGFRTITPAVPKGLVPVSQELEVAFAHAGLRMFNK